LASRDIDREVGAWRRVTVCGRVDIEGRAVETKRLTILEVGVTRCH